MLTLTTSHSLGLLQLNPNPPLSPSTILHPQRLQSLPLSSTHSAYIVLPPSQRGPDFPHCYRHGDVFSALRHCVLVLLSFLPRLRLCDVSSVLRLPVRAAVPTMICCLCVSCIASMRVSLYLRCTAVYFVHSSPPSVLHGFCDAMLPLACAVRCPVAICCVYLSCVASGRLSFYLRCTAAYLVHSSLSSVLHGFCDALLRPPSGDVLNRIHVGNASIYQHNRTYPLPCEL